jgi:hypothetical protein
VLNDLRGCIRKYSVVGRTVWGKFWRCDLALVITLSYYRGGKDNVPHFLYTEIVTPKCGGRSDCKGLIDKLFFKFTNIN